MHGGDNYYIILSRMAEIGTKYKIQIAETEADELLRFLKICLQRQEFTLRELNHAFNPDPPGLTRLDKHLEDRYLIGQQKAEKQLCKGIEMEIDYLKTRIDYLQQTLYNSALSRDFGYGTRYDSGDWSGQ